MLDTKDILETIRMISDENLDVRTVTMGISLLDCADEDPRRACEKIYQKITTRARNLVPVAEEISAAYGIPIVNKRISVTPIAMLLAGCKDPDPWNSPKRWTPRPRRSGSTLWAAFLLWSKRDFRPATGC